MQITAGRHETFTYSQNRLIMHQAELGQCRLYARNSTLYSGMRKERQSIERKHKQQNKREITT